MVANIAHPSHFVGLLAEHISSTNQASWVKNFRTRWMSTFWSAIASETFSGLHSTWSSSIRVSFLSACFATSLSTNQERITANKSSMAYNRCIICCYKLPSCFIEVCIFDGFLVSFLAFFAGKPIVVSSCPLGRPLFFTTGPTLIPKEKRLHSAIPFCIHT